MREGGHAEFAGQFHQKSCWFGFFWLIFFFFAYLYFFLLLQQHFGELMKIHPLVLQTPVSLLLFCCLQLYFIHFYALIMSESLNQTLDSGPEHQQH